jgi:hypothetical protein
MHLSIAALHDLAIACLQNVDEYIDSKGIYKLQLNSPKLGWSWNTTGEEVDVGNEDKDNTLPLAKGSSLHDLGIQVQDPLGRLLEKAGSFKEAAIIIADTCSLQIGYALKSPGERLDRDNFIEHSLMLM